MVIVVEEENGVAVDECEGDDRVGGRGDGVLLFCDGGGEKKGTASPQVLPRQLLQHLPDVNYAPWYRNLK